MNLLLRTASQIVNPLDSRRRFGFGSGVSGDSAFNPLIYSPAAWLDASQETLTNGDAAQPLDFSGNSRQFKNGTSTRRPTFTTNRQNGKPGFVFDAVDDYVLPDAALAIAMAFIVCKYNGSTFSGYSGLLNNMGNGGGDHFLIGDSGGTTFYPFHASLGTVTYRLNRAVSASRAAPMNAAGLITVKVATPQAGIRPGFGGDRLLAGRWWNGDLYEALLFTTAVSDADCVLIENYLAAKWGTP